MKHFSVAQRIPGRDLRYLEAIKRFARNPEGVNGDAPGWANSTVRTLTLHDYLLIKIDGAEPGQLSLLTYNATTNKFSPIGGLDFVRDIRAFKVLTTGNGNQIVFSQIRGHTEHVFSNQLLDFDGVVNQFRKVYEFQSLEEIRVEVLDTDRGDVLAQYSPHLDVVDLYEIKWTRDGQLALSRHGAIAKKGVTRVVSLGKNCIALLVDKVQVEIWRFDGDKYNKVFALSDLVSPVDIATCTFEGQQMIAVQCSGNVVSIFKMYIEAGSTRLVRYQTLQLGDQPLQMRFVLITSGELMLVVSTSSMQRSLIVYRYAGVSLFVERLGYSKLGISGRRISDLIIDSGGGDGRGPRAVILETITEQ